MAKGLCEDKKGWLEQLSSIGDKIKNILSAAKNAVKKMFGNTPISGLSDDKKLVRFNRDKKHLFVNE